MCGGWIQHHSSGRGRSGARSLCPLTPFWCTDDDPWPIQLDGLCWHPLGMSEVLTRVSAQDLPAWDYPISSQDHLGHKGILRPLIVPRVPYECRCKGRQLRPSHPKYAPPLLLPLPEVGSSVENKFQTKDTDPQRLTSTLRISAG